MTSRKLRMQQTEAKAPTKETAPEFNLTYPPNVPELYVDGISGMVAGWPISKLVLHTRHPNQEGAKESRHVVALLTMPTATLIELCRNVLAAYAGTEDQITKANQQLLGTVQTMLKGVKRPASPGQS